MATSGDEVRGVPALDYYYSYGWLCYVEWNYFKDQAEQPDSKGLYRKFHLGMQHYLFA